MASADRLLELLALLSTRSHWGADDLAERLEITERTVRRDIARLREIGYSIESEPGRHGGYRLVSGDKLPPLVLDDDEAMVMSVGLGAITSTGAPGMTDAAVSALVKLDRVLPPRLRERAAALRRVTLGLTGLRVPAVDTESLVTVALACERPERLRFDYRDAADRASLRWVEPYRLVFTSMRWYLVARDLDRDAWRTFRVDRMTDLTPSGVPFERHEVTDAVAQVAAGVAVHAYPLAVSVRFAASRAEVEDMIPRTVGLIDREDDSGVVVLIGGDVDWIARYLLRFSTPFEVLDSPEVVAELRRIGSALLEM